MDDRVVITGAGIICSLGDTQDKVWQAVLSGGSGVRPIQGFDTSGFRCRAGAQVPALSAGALGIHPRDSRIMDTHSFMLMKAGRDAFSQAGLADASIPREEIAFFAGMGMVDYEVDHLLPAVLKSLDRNGDLDYDAFYSEGYKEIYPLWPLAMLNNVGFCQVAIDLGIKGENTVFSPHADSGAQAIREGTMTVREGKSRVALAGGVSEKINPSSLARSHLFGILSDDQSGSPCRPFASDRSGTVLGEGCGIVALELSSSAMGRGVSPLASLIGYGAACEPGDGFPGPTVQALAGSMRGALEEADLRPSDVAVVIAHGDGSTIGDRNEIEAIHDVFSDCLDSVSVFSSKGALGHTLAAAPAIDLILGLSTIRAGTVPPTLTSSPMAPFCHDTVTQPFSKNAKRLMINCRSYEGQCASLIIEAFQV